MLHMIACVFIYRSRYDLILIDVYSIWNFYYAWAVANLARYLRIPYVPILHGGNLERRLIKNKRLSKTIFRYSAANVSPSLFLQHKFKEHGYASEYIPNSIELAEYSFRPRRQVSPKLLFVRTLRAEYNPEMAVRVLHFLVERGLAAELCFVGPEINNFIAARLASLAEQLGVEERITYTGKLSKEAWVTLSEKFDIFINTTNFDNFPVSIIEAMSLGFPIVSTNVGGIPFIITHGMNGLLVEANDHQAMGQAIDRLVNDPDLAEKLSVNARKFAEQLDWTVISTKWINLFQNVL